MFDLRFGDCLGIMKSIPDQSIDMVLCDLPYGTTQNKWDTVINLPAMWEQYERICKGVIVLTAQTPFDKVLGCSNLPMLKYEWIWRKEMGSGHLNAKKAPLKDHENILVFYKTPPTYNPQFSEGKAYKVKSGHGSSNYGSQEQTITENSGVRYPKTVIEFSRDRGVLFHPTQKPVALMEYLIRTYTNEGDTILDNCMGSGTTGVACMNTNREFIGIELNAEYFTIAAKRIADAYLSNA